MNFVEQRNLFDPSPPYANPRVTNLLVDPKEREPVEYPYMLPALKWGQFRPLSTVATRTDTRTDFEVARQCAVMRVNAGAGTTLGGIGAPHYGNASAGTSAMLRHRAHGRVSATRCGSIQDFGVCS